MPVFTYRAADRRGQTVDGVMEAADARAVVERLHREAFYPIRVEPHAERRRFGAVGSGRRVRPRELLAFTQQLATLFEAGLPLDRALTILEELAPTPRLKTIVTDLVHGDTVTEVLNYVQYSAEKLTDRVRKDVERAVRQGKISLNESRQLLRFYESGLEGYTYLEEPQA